MDSCSLISGTLHRWQLYQLLLQPLSTKHYVNFLDCIQWAVFHCELYWHASSISIPDLLVPSGHPADCWSSGSANVVSNSASLESFTFSHIVYYIAHPAAQACRLNPATLFLEPLRGVFLHQIRRSEQDGVNFI